MACRNSTKSRTNGTLSQVSALVKRALQQAIEGISGADDTGMTGAPTEVAVKANSEAQIAPHGSTDSHTPPTASEAYGQPWPSLPKTGFLRLPQVLALIPVGKSSWWRGVQSGIYPQPVKIGPRTTAWRAEDIAELIVRLGHTRGGM